MRLPPKPSKGNLCLIKDIRLGATYSSWLSLLSLRQPRDVNSDYRGLLIRSSGSRGNESCEYVAFVVPCLVSLHTREDCTRGCNMQSQPNRKRILVDDQYFPSYEPQQTLQSGQTCPGHEGSPVVAPLLDTLATPRQLVAGSLPPQYDRTTNLEARNSFPIYTP